MRVSNVVWTVGIVGGVGVSAFLVVDTLRPDIVNRTSSDRRQWVSQNLDTVPDQDEHPASVGGNSSFSNSEKSRTVADVEISGHRPEPPEPLSKVVAEFPNTREPRDNEWADTIERRFAERALSSDLGVSIELFECGSVRCAASLHVSNREAFDAIPGWFGDGAVAFEGRKLQSGGYEYNAIFSRDGYRVDGSPLR